MDLALRSILLLLCVASVGNLRVAQSAEILQHVPRSALGFVVLKNLDATDVKVDALLNAFGSPYPSPLVFLKTVTGIDEGLNVEGDFMLAVLPGRETGSEPQYAVWLPVTDYDLLLQSLDASPGQTISAARIADEDLLIARQGEWAIIMDPDQRDQMEQMLEASPNPPEVVREWTDWLNGSDLSAVLLRRGIGQVLNWSESPAGAAGNDADARRVAEDPFGPTDDGGIDPQAAASNPLYGPIRREVYRWVIRSPELKDLATSASAIGVVARLDEAGHGRISLRLRSEGDDLAGGSSHGDVELPSQLYRKGEFVLHGAGHLPPPWMNAAAAVYVRKMLDDLMQQERIRFEEQSVQDFQEAYRTAVSDVVSWSILTQPGDQNTGIYNNNFLALRVNSSETFVDHVGEVMRMWNKMHRNAEGEARYVFDIEETEVRDRAATQYLLDVASIDNMPVIPEVRKIMERFFGPGGKMRLWVVPLDERTVLLGAGTQEQIETAVQALGENRPLEWQQPEIAAANALLEIEPEWRVFFSPRGRFEWKKRQNDAMNDVPVIGARKPKDFSASPPIALAGKVDKKELTVDVVVPEETIKAAGAYFKK